MFRDVIIYYFVFMGAKVMIFSKYTKELKHFYLKIFHIATFSNFLNRFYY